VSPVNSTAAAAKASGLNFRMSATRTLPYIR
jgi:hypothetical protein